MPRKKVPTVEIVRAYPAQPVPQPNPAKLEALLDRLVQERVAEVMARRDDFFLEPCFRSKRVTDEIRRHQTVFEHRRWAVYFERWGCLICHRKKAVHMGNAYCARCRGRIVHRLKAIEREQAKTEYAQDSGQDPIEQIVSRVRSAERLLGGGEDSR